MHTQTSQPRPGFPVLGSRAERAGLQDMCGERDFYVWAFGTADGLVLRATRLNLRPVVSRKPESRPSSEVAQAHTPINLEASRDTDSCELWGQSHASSVWGMAST